jgi:hypothetical protein
LQVSAASAANSFDFLNAEPAYLLFYGAGDLPLQLVQSSSTRLLLVRAPLEPLPFPLPFPFPFPWNFSKESQAEGVFNKAYYLVNFSSITEAAASSP